MIDEYRVMLDEILGALDHGNFQTAVVLARLPDQVRGFGPVKERACEAMQREYLRLIDIFRNGESIVTIVEAA